MTAPLREVFVPAGSWGEHDEEIRANGWSVVNAPRPLAGRRTWQGEFRCGVFYAAGPVSEWGESWRADDAALLVQVTVDEVAERVREYVEGNGYTVAEFAEMGMLPQVAEDLGLPWEEGAA